MVDQLKKVATSLTLRLAIHIVIRLLRLGRDSLLLLLRRLLGRSGSDAVSRSDVELVANLGPRVASRARVAHTSVLSQLLVVDLSRWISTGFHTIWRNTYVGRTGLERLHGPGQHLHLALGESGTGSASVIAGVRHGDGCARRLEDLVVDKVFGSKRRHSEK